MEEWRSVIGHEGLYETSSFGRVRNSRTGKILKPKNKDNGYHEVCLSKDGKQKMFYVHRLVYAAFNGKIPEWMQIDHVDGDKTNNNLRNLRCVTSKENNNNPVTRQRLVEATRKACNKSIIQINKKTGETIKRWECMHDVERELGIYQGNISSCCQGKRQSAGGFKWRFAS